MELLELLICKPTLKLKRKQRSFSNHHQSSAVFYRTGRGGTKTPLSVFKKSINGVKFTTKSSELEKRHNKLLSAAAVIGDAVNDEPNINSK